MYNGKAFRLDDQVAVVTGAGIGRAIALMFAGAGAAVVVSDRDVATAEAVAEEIRSAGGRATGVACDVTREADLERLVETATTEYSRLTTLISNAGGGGPRPFDMPMDDFRRAFDLNVFSVFRLAQLAAPAMHDAGGGTVLAISSMAGENKNERMASYGSSKAAVSHLVRNIAFDLGPYNVRVNAIAPGATRTAALQSVLNDQIEQQMLAHTPIKRLGEPADIANAALFLCAPAANWISGQELTVSGGGLQELN